MGMEEQQFERITIATVRISAEEKESDRMQLDRHIQQLLQSGASRVFWDVAARTSDLIDRPGLQKALDLVRSGCVASILIPDVSRLTTNQVLLAQVIRIAVQHKTSIISMNIGIDITSDTGQMLAEITAAGGGFEYRQIKSRLRRNRSFEVKNNIHRGGVRFGYRRVGGKLELDTRPFLCLISTKEERSIAQIALHQIELFERLLSSTQTVAAIHDYYGIHPPLPLAAEENTHEVGIEDLQSFRRKTRRFVRGTFCWTEQGLLDWIRDPILHGDRVADKYKQVIDDKGNERRRLKPQSEWTIVKDGAPALIDRKRHANILRSLQGHSTPAKSGVHAKHNLFKKLVYCGECGSVCNLQNSGIGKGENRNLTFVYQCTAYVKDRGRRKRDPKTIGVCSQQKQIRIEKVEAAVIAELTAHAKQVLQNAKQSELDGLQDTAEPIEVVEIRQQLAKLKAMDDPDLMLAIAAKEKKLASTIEALQQSESVRTMNDAAVARAFGNPKFWARLSFEEKRDLLHDLIDRIVVRNGAVVSVMRH